MQETQVQDTVAYDGPISDDDPSLKTLGDIGASLPIALESGEHPSFGFRPWRMAEEKQVGRLKAKYGKQFGVFVRQVLDFMLTDWNGSNWQEMKENDRKLLLNQLAIGNIFYMYIYLRFDALGETVKFTKFECPSCEAEMPPFAADLSSLDVRTREKNPRHVIYNLKKPFPLGEVTVTGLKAGFTPWDAMEKAKVQGRNEGAIKEAMILHSIHAAMTEEGGEVPLERNKLLANLAKKDIEGAWRAVDRHNGGPILGVECSCEACGHEWSTPLDWSWDYFFSTSSLSET